MNISTLIKTLFAQLCIYFKNILLFHIYCSFFLGSTEVFGFLSAFDMNLPVYGGEIQVPALGIDLKCFDSEGKFMRISLRLRLLLKNSVVGALISTIIKI